MKKYKFLLFFFPIVAFTLLLYFVGAESIIDAIGISNSYVFMFFIALLGGVSIFSGVPYSLILITFAIGGLNPWILGITTATGLFLGDSTSYFLGTKTKFILSDKMQEIFDVLLKLYDTNPRYLIPFFFVYGAVSPLPNDMITISSGMKGYGFLKTMIPLALGNVIFCCTLSYFADFFAGYIF